MFPTKSKGAENPGKEHTMKKEFSNELERLSNEVVAFRDKVKAAGAKGTELDEYDFEEVLEALDMALCGLDNAVR